MLIIRKHITTISDIIRDSLIIPAGVKKLVAVGVISETTCTHIGPSAYTNYNIRLMVNNKADNPLNYDFEDSFIDPAVNVNVRKRLIEMNYDLKVASKIDYIITHNLASDKPVKLYLKFE